MRWDVVGYESAPLRTFGYVSTPTVPFSDRDLTDLLLSARRVNAQCGVTGKLIVLEDGDEAVRFAQFLEGPRAGLERVVGRVRADTRHHALRVVTEGTAQDRRFPGWDMAFEPIGEAVFEAASAELLG
ncbi:BLUF domain-containing protein [Rubrivirga sp.]|uniref:BLUF domain-containing protein n=1 Tax=Rubrivirga sp. TaxID=1885344 RepID=UPI003B52D21F